MISLLPVYRRPQAPAGASRHQIAVGRIKGHVKNSWRTSAGVCRPCKDHAQSSSKQHSPLVVDGTSATLLRLAAAAKLPFCMSIGLGNMLASTGDLSMIVLLVWAACGSVKTCRLGQLHGQGWGISRVWESDRDLGSTCIRALAQPLQQAAPCRLRASRQEIHRSQLPTCSAPMARHSAAAAALCLALVFWS